MPSSALVDRPPAPTERSEARIRAFAAADAQDVANLLVRAFQHKDAPGSPELAAYLRRVYLEAPWFDPEIASRVVESTDGRIVGFAGVVAQKMRVGDRTIRTALTSSLAVDDRAGDPTLAVRLLRHIQAGPQDAILADRSNRASVALSRPLKSELIQCYSLDWLRVLRPAGFAISEASSRIGPARLLAPVATLADRVLLSRHLKSGKLRWATPTLSRSAAHYTDRDIDIDELLDLIPELLAPFQLRPDWSRDELAVILTDIADKRDLGDFVARVVLTPSGTPAGVFLYHARKGRTAHVAQILAAPGRWGPVLDRAIEHALDNGAVAMRGRATPQLMSELMERRAIFLPDLATTVFARDPEIIRHFRQGTAFFTGLSGENWMRLNGDRF